MYYISWCYWRHSVSTNGLKTRMMEGSRLLEKDVVGSTDARKLTTNVRWNGRRDIHVADIPLKAALTLSQMHLLSDISAADNLYDLIRILWKLIGVNECVWRLWYRSGFEPLFFLKILNQKAEQTNDLSNVTLDACDDAGIDHNFWMVAGSIPG